MLAYPTLCGPPISAIRTSVTRLPRTRHIETPPLNLVLCAAGTLLVSGRQECQIIISTTLAGITQSSLLIWAALPVGLITFRKVSARSRLYFRTERALVVLERQFFAASRSKKKSPFGFVLTNWGSGHNHELCRSVKTQRVAATFVFTMASHPRMTSS